MSFESALGLAILGSAVPVAGWLIFFYTRDRYDREPKQLILLLFFMGAIPVGLVAGLVNSLFIGLVGMTVVAILIAPAGEEVLKYLGTRMTALRSKAFDEPVDGMIYGSAVGLGFAFAENVGYLITGAVGPIGPGDVGLCEPGLGCFSQLVLLRGLGTAVIHAVATGIAGHYLARHALAGQPQSMEWRGLGLAFLIHAGWNSSILALPALIGGVWGYMVLVRRSLAASPRRLEQIDDGKHRVEHFAVRDGLLQPCPSCQKLHSAELHYCTFCGYQLLQRAVPHSRACPNCAQPQPTTARFCSNCGQTLPEVGAMPSPEPGGG